MKLFAFTKAIANNNASALDRILQDTDLDKETLQGIIDDALIEACTWSTVQPEIIDVLKDYGASKQAVFKALIGRSVQGIPPSSTYALLHDITPKNTVIKRRTNLTTLEQEYILEEVLSFE